MAGTTRALWVYECGDIGVIIKACVSGYIIGPPTARLYAVEPVGVEIINPSPLYVLNQSPSIDAFMLTILETARRVITTSLNAKNSLISPSRLSI